MAGRRVARVETPEDVDAVRAVNAAALDADAEAGQAYGLEVVNRFRVEPEEETEFRGRLQAASEALAERPGWVGGGVARNLDDPTLWLLHSRWRDVGSYRRALSAYEVKVTAVPVLSQAIDEPSAYEPVVPGATLNEASARSLG